MNYYRIENGNRTTPMVMSQTSGSLWLGTGLQFQQEQQRVCAYCGCVKAAGLCQQCGASKDQDGQIYFGQGRIEFHDEAEGFDSEKYPWKVVQENKHIFVEALEKVIEFNTQSYLKRLWFVLTGRKLTP